LSSPNAFIGDLCHVVIDSRLKHAGMTDFMPIYSILQKRGWVSRGIVARDELSMLVYFHFSREGVRIRVLRMLQILFENFAKFHNFKINKNFGRFFETENSTNQNDPF